ncbi:MAG: carboxypeptidase-like regulatory domain-containing protein [Pseudobacter sp.]|uniref:STN domain-containing protein n=1 Tax=Pseudobacter sp. TaxID=2045420 RepID=UPI003F8000A5
MRLTAILLLAGCLQVAAGSKAQTISFSGKAVPLENVFASIKQQTGYAVFFDYDVLENAAPVTMKARSVPLYQFLDQLIAGRQLRYSIRNETIFFSKSQDIPEKPISLLLVVPRITISGQVFDASGKPLPGASVRISGTAQGVSTDADGRFSIDAKEGNQIVISYIGYNSLSAQVEKGKLTPAGNNSNGGTIFFRDNICFIRLALSETRLSEVGVVSTGYQVLPRDRATGSFTLIDSALLSRQVSSSLIDRLEGVTSGLLVTKSRSIENVRLTIRGRSTIHADQEPLIVLDNFPYEGNIENINPNDVASVTILKDAAAASIWGVRAGNGVIVITTKKGKLNQKTTITFNSSITVGMKPNLFAEQQLSSAETVDLEQFLFDKGRYNSQINNRYPVISPAVGIMLRKRNNHLTAEEAVAQLNQLRQYDNRNDLLKYFYEYPVNQQYSLNFSGGGSNNTYMVSGGFDHNLRSEKFRTYQRFT